MKDIEENNRMEKTRDHFKKMRDTKGTFCEKKGTMLNKWYGTKRTRKCEEVVARIHRRTIQKRSS